VRHPGHSRHRPDPFQFRRAPQAGPLHGPEAETPGARLERHLQRRPRHPRPWAALHRWRGARRPAPGGHAHRQPPDGQRGDLQPQGAREGPPGASRLPDEVRLRGDPLPLRRGVPEEVPQRHQRDLRVRALRSPQRQLPHRPGSHRRRAPLPGLGPPGEPLRGLRTQGP